MTDRQRGYGSYGYGAENMNRAQQQGESEAECLDRLATQIKALQVERASVALILETFRNSPLTVSSVQPVLALAERLNGPMVPR